MAKRKVAKKTNVKDSCEVNDKCDCSKFMIRIGAMAFILFLVTVWPAVGNWLVGVPWWVYLIIWVVFCGGAMGMKNNCLCKK